MSEQDEYEYTDDKRIVTLELVYDDSDGMTDYYHPDRTYETWVVCKYQGKRITEPRLRDAIKHLPAWIQALNWTWQKGEPYSMSHHPRGQLRVDGGIDSELTVKAYGGRSGMGFLLGTDWLNGLFKANYPNWGSNKPPASLDELKATVKEKETIRNKPPTIQEQEKRLEGHIREIQSSHAVIGAQGFQVMTEELKAVEIDKLRKDFLTKYIR